MKNLRKSWKVIIPFALVAILILGYAVRTRAFTLIELPFSTLPFLETSAVTGTVTVTNVSGNNLLVVIAIINDAGGVFQQGPSVELLPAHTYVFPINKLAVGVAPQFLRASVTVNGSENFSSALIGLHVFNANNQIVELLPAVQFGFPPNF